MDPCGTFHTNYNKDMAIVRTKTQWVLLLALLVVLLILPLLIDDYAISIFNRMAVVLIAVLGVNVVIGFCGQIMLGQAAFMAIGAYGSAILTSRLGYSFWVALPFGGLLAALVGLLFALPSLRVKGLYLALSTLAAQFIIMWVIIHVPSLTGGANGMLVPPPTIGPITIITQQTMYYVVITITIVMVFLATNIARSHMGRVFIAIRDNDLAAEVMGVNIFPYKVLAFIVCAFYAGIAGALYAHWNRGVHPESFSLLDSIWYIAILIVGGMGTIMGAIFGTIFLELLRLTVNIVSPLLASVLPGIGMQLVASLGQVVFGLVVVVFLIFQPKGLNHGWEILKRSYRLWPFSHL